MPSWQPPLSSWSERVGLLPDIRFVERTGSTNADLLAKLAAGEHPSEGSWLVADRQIAGRGRRGRSWIDAPGNFMGSTLVSLGLRDPPPASLSFVAALAVYETIVAQSAEPQRLQLKWPNDVLLDGVKFCGILLEREGGCAVVGIGVNLAHAPDTGGRVTRSLARHGPAPDRDSFAHALAMNFAGELERWRLYGTGPIFQRWLAAAHPLGAPLSVHDPDGTKLSGSFAGLADDGALRLCLDDGVVRVVHAGDVELEAVPCC